MLQILLNTFMLPPPLLFYFWTSSSLVLFPPEVPSALEVRTIAYVPLRRHGFRCSQRVQILALHQLILVSNVSLHRAVGMVIKWRTFTFPLQPSSNVMRNLQLFISPHNDIGFYIVLVTSMVCSCLYQSDHMTPSWKKILTVSIVRILESSVTET